MGSDANKPDAVTSEGLSKPSGFGTQRRKPGPAPQPDPGPTATVDPWVGARAFKPHGGQRKRHGSFTQPLTASELALSKDAKAQARQLRRKHRALYTADARRFR